MWTKNRATRRAALQLALVGLVLVVSSQLGQLGGEAAVTRGYYAPSHGGAPVFGVHQPGGLVAAGGRQPAARVVGPVGRSFWPGARHVVAAAGAAPGLAWREPATLVSGRNAPVSTTAAPIAAVSSTRAPSRASTVAPSVTSSTTATTTTTAATPSTRPANIAEICSHVSANAERQLLAYVSSIESITGTIQELDDVVQQMRPRACSAEAQQMVAGSGSSATDVASVSSTTTTTSTTAAPMYWAAAGDALVNSSRVEPVEAAVAPEIAPEAGAVLAIENVEFKTTTSTTPAPSTTAGGAGELEATVTTESFFDVTVTPSVSVSSESLNVEGRARRAEPAPHFGMPVAHAPSQDPAGEDLVRASEDLRALRRDLSSTAEMLKQTNHSVHSALLRALLSYVSSIERRIDNQRAAYVQARSSAALRLKIDLIKEKMAVLLEKLKSLIPFGSHGNNNSNYGPIVNN